MIQLRVHATPLCPGSIFEYDTETVTAEIGNDMESEPRNKTDGMCGRRISIFANITQNELKLKGKKV
uniref:TIGR04076 family protein n=1 Tax=Strongyloides papillosus TaxID=174720 RepID=A0A0N5CA45_STREA